MRARVRPDLPAALGESLEIRPPKRLEFVGVLAAVPLVDPGPAKKRARIDESGDDEDGGRVVECVEYRFRAQRRGVPVVEGDRDGSSRQRSRVEVRDEVTQGEPDVATHPQKRQLLGQDVRRYRRRIRPDGADTVVADYER